MMTIMDDPLVTGHTTITIGVVYRCPNITIHNAVSEVSKGDCIIMGDFNHVNIKWDSQQSMGVEEQTCLGLVQDNFLTQHVLEPARAASGRGVHGSAVECPTLERGNTVTNPPTAYTLAPLMATRCGVVTP